MTASRRPDEGAIERGAAVVDQFAVADQIDPGGRHIAQRRQGERRDDIEPRGQLPGDREQQQRQISGGGSHHAFCSCALIASSRTRFQISVDFFDELLAAQNARIALAEFGVDDGLDLARPRRHHRHPFGEIDRLLHVVGDEDHGLGRALPDAQQLGLHQRAGLRVERAERLVHQQDARIESPACARSRCAASCRRTVATDSCPRSRAGRPDR